MDAVQTTRNETGSGAHSLPIAADASGTGDTAETAVLRIYSIVALVKCGIFSPEYATALLLKDRAEHARRVLAGWIYVEV